MFKLAVLNRERDIDKVWRDWNVYCFEEKKKKSFHHCNFEDFYGFCSSAIIRGLVTCRKKEISCQCFSSIVTSFFKGRKKLVERCYGETLGRYSFLRHDLYPEASNGNKWSPIVLPRLSSISQPPRNPIILLLLKRDALT